MDRATIAFTAVYFRAQHGYVGFVEELPGVNSQGRTIDEARANLQRLAAIVFGGGGAHPGGEVQGQDRGRATACGGSRRSCSTRSAPTPRR